MPDLFELVDFSVQPEFLDKELEKLLSQRKRKGVNFCDKLVKMRLKNGKDRWILVHIEIQKADEPNFPQRMFTYFSRIYDRYGLKGHDIEALAIFIDEVAPEHQVPFKYEVGQTRLEYHYCCYSIFQRTEEELYNDPNPFAIVILASQYAVKQELGYQLYALKERLVELALERGYDENIIASILHFVIFAVTLPEASNKQFRNDILKTLKKHDFMKTTDALDHKTRLAEYLFGDEVARIKRKYNREVKQQKLSMELAMKQLSQEGELAVKQKEMEKEQALKQKEVERCTSIKKLYNSGISISQIANCYNLSETEALNIVNSQL